MASPSYEQETGTLTVKKYLGPINPLELNGVHLIKFCHKKSVLNVFIFVWISAELMNLHIVHTVIPRIWMDAAVLVSLANEGKAKKE